MKNTVDKNGRNPVQKSMKTCQFTEAFAKQERFVYNFNEDFLAVRRIKL